MDKMVETDENYPGVIRPSNLQDAYRKKVFFNYEKWIRMRSPPEKVFEYFASFCADNGEIFMTPADLMRAVVPVFPPSESHLVRDGCLRGERSPGELRCAPSEFFMLFDIDNDGLISFKEDFSFNTMTGNLPNSFSSLTSMTKMYLQNNQFTGTIDLLADLSLDTLNVENNHFSG